MELLLAFLISFGVVSTKSASELTKSEAETLLKSSDLENDYIIWEAEGDDF